MERKYEEIEEGRKYEGKREKEKERGGRKENIKKEEGDEETRSTLRL